MDERFAAILGDPRFRTLKRNEKKIKVDNRFHGMFQEKRFDCETNDKRGRTKTIASSENLKRFYDVSTDSESDIEIKEPRKIKIPDARGQNDDDSDSVSSSSDEESESETEVDHNWGEFDKDVPRDDVVSKRLAICNIDWDRIKAVDLYVLVNSFKPAEGTVISVKIYLSEFGKQRLIEEKIKGPKELVEVTLSETEADPFEKPIYDEDHIINDESSHITEKLRTYQLNRLKYYYAVVECNSAETAVALYDNLDGMEYESSASALDLRFISDDIEFDEKPSSECYAMPDFVSYKPPIFITTALQQCKVRLTWDETDPTRKNKLLSTFKQGDKCDDINTYLASSESDDDNNDNINEELVQSIDDNNNKDKIDKYKSLLSSLEKRDEEEDIDVEITWEPNLKATAENIVKEKNREKDASVFEREKAKKRKSRKPEVSHLDTSDKLSDNEREQCLELVTMSDEQKHHFNYDDLTTNKKRKSKQTVENDDFEMNLNDSRFTAIYTSSNFNIDQSNPNFKRTKGMEKLLHQKQQYIQKRKGDQKETKVDVNLSTLVNSVKNKARNKSFGKS